MACTYSLTSVSRINSSFLPGPAFQAVDEKVLQFRINITILQIFINFRIDFKLKTLPKFHYSRRRAKGGNVDKQIYSLSPLFETSSSQDQLKKTVGISLNRKPPTKPPKTLPKKTTMVSPSFYYKLYIKIIKL